MLLTGIYRGLVLSSNGIRLNTHLAIKVNIFGVDYGAVKLRVVKGGLMITFYFEACPTFV